MTEQPEPAEVDVLRYSPLDAWHRSNGARMVPFGGWEMPLEYEHGTVAEHMSCRRDVAIFDVSHLGTVRLTGPDVKATLQRALTNDLGKIGPGRAQYTHLLDDDGSVLDDLIVWWAGEETFDVMPNASNTSRVRGAIGGTDVTASRAVLAVQGPHARNALAKAFPGAAAVASGAAGVETLPASPPPGGLLDVMGWTYRPRHFSLRAISAWLVRGSGAAPGAIAVRLRLRAADRPGVLVFGRYGGV